jgi:UDP-N-acetylglucosamine enolpyruvyl transferase
MGAQIEGEGTRTIRIQESRRHGCRYSVIASNRSRHIRYGCGYTREIARAGLIT